MLEVEACGACLGLLPPRAACLVPVSVPRPSFLPAFGAFSGMHAVRRVTGVRASPVAANPTLAA